MTLFGEAARQVLPMCENIESVEECEYIASECEPKLHHFACKKFRQNEVTCNRILTDEEVAVDRQIGMAKSVLAQSVPNEFSHVHDGLCSRNSCPCVRFQV